MANKEPAKLSQRYELGIPYLGSMIGAAGARKIRGGGALTFALSEALRKLIAGQKVYFKLARERQEGQIRQLLLSMAPQVLEAPDGKTGKRYPAPFFGRYDFASTVGLWLKTADEPAAALLSPFISTDSFEFTPTEFVDLRERLERTMRRFARLPQVSKSLEDLNTGFFRHRSLEESRQFISTHLDGYLERAGILQREYQLLINGHARSLLFKRQGELAARRQYVVAIREEVNQLNEIKGRRRRRQFREGIAKWSAYRQEWCGDLTPVDPQLPFPALKESLQAEVREIDQQRKNLNREIRPVTLSLSPVTEAGNVPLAGALSQLGEELRTLIREIDESGLYQLPLGGTDAATAPRQLQLLEGVRDRLRNTHRHLHELDDFYARRHFWYSQPARLRRLLAPLQELPPEEWEVAFSSWYFERCLQRADVVNKDRLEPAVIAALLPTLAAGVTVDWKQIVFMSAKDEPPEKVETSSLYIDLSGGECPEDWAEAHFLSIRPVHDETADHYQLAGRLEAGLLFGQTFLPVTAPDWAEVKTTEPPPGSKGRLSVQTREEGEWQLLSEWDGITENSLHLFIPNSIEQADGDDLLTRIAEVMTRPLRIRIFHSWSNDDVTRALLSDGVTAEFLVAVLIRAADAANIVPFDREAMVALGREYRTRCGLTDPPPHPLAESIVKHLKKGLPNHFFEVHQPWRDTFLPLVVLSPDGKKTVLLPDGRLPGYASVTAEALRQRELRAAGFYCLDLRADRVWMNLEEEVERITAALG